MESILNTDFIVDSNRKQNNFITTFKNKLDIVTIIVLVIIAVAILTINYIPGSFSFIKLLKNKCVKCILTGLLLIYAYCCWCTNKVSVILLTIILGCLFYVVNDDIENVEHFTEFYYSNINDNNMKTVPEYNLNSQEPYKTVGCTHLEPNGECELNKNDVDNNGPQLNNIGLSGYSGETIGADLNGDGNDTHIQNNMLGFGNTYNTNEPFLMMPLNGNNFLKENDARQTLIQNRGKISKIFDARDLKINTNNGIKKAETYKNINMICDGTICTRPDILQV